MESPQKPSQGGRLLASLILMVMCLALLGMTLWLGQARRQWQQEDLQIARAVYVKWIDAEPNPSGDGSSLLLKVDNNSATECARFTIEVQWTSEGGQSGTARKDFTQALARGQEVTLPPWPFPVKAGQGTVWSARVIPETKA